MARTLTGFVLPAIVALSSACTPSQQPSDAPESVVDSTNAIQVLTDRASYRSGETVQLRIVNGKDRQYAFNPCTRILERRDGDRWVPVQDSRMCTMIAWLIEPGQTRTATTEIQAGLSAGTYRLVISFSSQDSRAEIVLAPSAPLSIANQ